MLSSASTETIRATLPVVGAAIGEITPIFYRRLFAAHPALERDMFNRGNQAQGDQQRALAAAIARYATLLVDDTVTDPRGLLVRIAHKHASLGITPPQYDIVHEHLFAAIVEVLGDVVTPAVAAAWDEVYWDMAHALIDIENGLYTDAGVTAGDVWQNLVVRRRVQETTDTVSFLLADAAGGQLPPAGRPGQYVSVAVILPDGARQIRQYSLTRSSEPGTLSISVKAIAASAGHDGDAPAGEVSNFLHRHVTEGDVLQVSRPFGELDLTDGDSPLLLVSAGIGITPMIGFLRHMHRTGSRRTVTVLHSDRSPARHAHRAELADLVDRLPAASLHRWYGDLEDHPADDTVRQGRIDLAGVPLPEDVDLYLCGPLPFMASVYRAALERGIPANRVHYEVFGPTQDLAAA